MSKAELPILKFGQFRKYPTRRDQQEYDDYRHVCQDCISGGCCSSEDPIYLTSFDVFRLAAFFDMSPAEFMLKFTQDRFNDPEGDEIRRILIEDRECSIVTYLRRRENLRASPCIFLKYVREADGTPRRICSVHDGRPLACREFYFNHCRARVTGELAALQAEGFEKLRDGDITEEMIDGELATIGLPDPESATLAQKMQYFFWVEMKRAINMNQANTEGANSYTMADYQDPIEEKLNRVLSAKHLRFEEKYGPKPRDEQLNPYTAGLEFAGSAEYERIMRILRSPPSSGLYAAGNYSSYIGMRTLFPGAQHPSAFSTIPDSEMDSFLRGIPRDTLFPSHDMAEVRSLNLRDVHAALLKAYNHLIRFASYVATMENILEGCEPGFIETELFLMVSGFETGGNRFIAQNPYLQPVKHYMARAAIDSIEEKLKSETSPRQVFDHFRFLCRANPVLGSLPLDLQERFESARVIVDAGLNRDRLDLYVSRDNPVAARAAAGKPLNTIRAWNTWYDQVLDMRYAAMAGFDGVDLQEFYQQSVNDIERIPLRKSYLLDLYDIVCNLARSMSFYNSIPYSEMEYKDSGERLAAFAVRLFERMEQEECQNRDCEIIAGFLSAVYRGLGLNHNHDRSFGLILYRILDSQLPDGSWNTDSQSQEASHNQSDYICSMYKSTWDCIEAIAPMDDARRIN